MTVVVRNATPVVQCPDDVCPKCFGLAQPYFGLVETERVYADRSGLSIVFDVDSCFFCVTGTPKVVKGFEKQRRKWGTNTVYAAMLDPDKSGERIRHVLMRNESLNIIALACSLPAGVLSFEGPTVVDWLKCRHEERTEALVRLQSEIDANVRQNKQDVEKRKQRSAALDRFDVLVQRFAESAGVKASMAASWVGEFPGIVISENDLKRVVKLLESKARK